MITKKLTKKQWKEAKEGYGLEEVPREIAKELVCCMCGVKWPGKLYTDLPLPNASTVRLYSQQVDSLIQNCYCRYHAEQMFGSREEVLSKVEDSPRRRLELVKQYLTWAMGSCLKALYGTECEVVTIRFNIVDDNPTAITSFGGVKESKKEKML